MGTNYYLGLKDNRNFNEIFHIGKSSAGWFFLWRGQYSTVLSNKKQWLSFLESIKDIDKFVVMDEYGGVMTISSFLEYIEERDNPEGKEIKLSHHEGGDTWFTEFS